MYFCLQVQSQILLCVYYDKTVYMLYLLVKLIKSI